MINDLESIPGFKRHPVRDYVYVQAQSPQEFRDFMRSLQKMPGVRGPTSGTARFPEQMLTTPEGELYFAVMLIGDTAGWRSLLQAHSQPRDMQFAEIEGSELVIGGTKRVALAQCELEFSKGKMRSLTMQQHEWRPDWLSFVEYVAREIERGTNNEELSMKFESEQVRWAGQVAKLKLESQYSRGVALKMEPVRRKLASGFFLIAGHLFLRAQDPAQLSALGGLKVGDEIGFSSRIRRSNTVFPVINLSTHAPEKEIFLEVSMELVELVLPVR